MRFRTDAITDYFTGCLGVMEGQPASSEPVAVHPAHVTYSLLQRKLLASDCQSSCQQALFRFQHFARQDTGIVHLRNFATLMALVTHSRYN